MALTPELQAQLDEQKKQCVFCKIIAQEIPAKVVFEDDKTIALLDIYPAVKGHTLYLPKEHYPLLPYVPPDECAYFFGLLPRLSQAITESMVTTALNIFITNGNIAGQQAPHFLLHILPREAGDSFFHFLLPSKGKKLSEKEQQFLTQNFPLLMRDHFSKNKLSWHSGAGTIPAFLEKTSHNSIVLYEDEKVLVLLAEPAAVPGQIDIYSKQEGYSFEKLPAEDAVHLFTVASAAASLVFQALSAQGTNIILRSGKTDDHPSGRVCLQVLPRKQDDGLQELLWKPKPPSYNLDSIVSKIKDKTWKVKLDQAESGENKVLLKPEIIKIIGAKPAERSLSTTEEIRKAIEKVR